MDNKSELIELLHEQLNATKNVPLYVTFVETVRQAVLAGIMKEGDFLPSERDFSKRLGISRITVRKALELLHEQNLVTRARGYGTVINSKFEYSLKDAKGFSQQVVLKGKKPDTVWVNKTVIPCSDDVALRLSLTPGCDVFMLKRIRYADNEPISIEESYVPISLINDVDQIGMSLYDYFHSQHIYPKRTKSWVTAQMPDKEFQELLKLPKIIPVLLIKQVAFDIHDKPIEYSINYCRSDMYTFIAEE